MLDKRYRPAIEKLIAHYKQFPEGQVKGLDKTSYCPLCAIDRILTKGECKSCPWIVYGDIICIHKPYELDPAGVRIKRLKGWLEGMEEEE